MVLPFLCFIIAAFMTITIFISQEKMQSKRRRKDSGYKIRQNYQHKHLERCPVRYASKLQKANGQNSTESSGSDKDSSTLGSL